MDPREMFAVPPSVTQNIARARGLLRRNEAVRAIEALQAALNLFEPAKIIGKNRYETEIHLMESVDELTGNPRVRAFLQSVSKSKNPTFKYVPGEEAKLVSLLGILHKALNGEDEAARQADQGNREERRDALWEKGSAYLESGDLPRGRAALARLADEYGVEPGILAKVGEALFAARQYDEAIPFLEEAVERFPKDSKAYSLLADSYIATLEYAKAEELFVRFLRQFGKHPNTLLKFARLYKLWNKRDEAFEIAQNALKLAPDNPELQEILKWADR